MKPVRILRRQIGHVARRVALGEPRADRPCEQPAQRLDPPVRGLGEVGLGIADRLDVAQLYQRVRIVAVRFADSFKDAPARRLGRIIELFEFG